MKKRILFVAQCWHGRGGMQRYAHDLWGMLERDEPINASACTPYTSGMKAMPEVSVRAFVRSMFIRPHTVLLASADLALLGWVLAKILRIRICIAVMGLDLLLKRKWYQWMLRKCLPAADRVVCISEATAEVAVSKGARRESIVIIPPGIHVRHAEEPPKGASRSAAPLLLSVGRLIKRKGHLWFVQNVMPELSKRIPDVRYRHLGRGPDLEEIERVVRELGLESHVEILSDADDSVRDVSYREASLYVMPNISVEGNMEGFGIVCIEASLRGVPVAAANIEGIRDAVIEGKTGRFFAAENAAECAQVISEMLANPLDSAGIRAETVERFDWKTLYERWRREAFGLMS